ncbi:hypothetical protein BGZ60DRAFT_523868 [Tricladium varicosporioides]|nr:hypothetical protein BGZ60DRAFT_523868 [Hymenoscyphus varicosporioides]
MFSLTSTARFSTIQATTIARFVASRPFSISSSRTLEQSDRHDLDQAKEKDKHLKDQLQKQKDGKGHWKPELASGSEEAVAADRQSGSDSIEEMQKKTIDHAKKKQK